MICYHIAVELGDVVCVGVPSVVMGTTEGAGSALCLLDGAGGVNFWVGRVGWEPSQRSGVGHAS